uniref:Uncharacterized protein n=1 Tax=Candidatus Kentrum sp. TC TaxID=2126339 RepID=A0A450YK73_9GAMM|nr:MAG: hypothetical protein BECKTC1821E_GA0114239_101535 [Candidatus Kentron sp. TC]
MNMPSDNWLMRGSNSKRWRMGFFPVPTLLGYKALAHKWLGKLSNPFTQENHEAGFNYKISILQAEFSRTRVFDRHYPGDIYSKKSSAKTSTWGVLPK